MIGQWNLIAQTTLLGDVTKKPQEHFLYLSFLNIAMYDAVVGIHGRYQPYALHASPAADVSDEAAVAAAAHHILETYSPYAQGALDTAYDNALVGIPETSQVQWHRIRNARGRHDHRASRERWPQREHHLQQDPRPRACGGRRRRRSSTCSSRGWVR